MGACACPAVGGVSRGCRVGDKGDARLFSSNPPPFTDFPALSAVRTAEHATHRGSQALLWISASQQVFPEMTSTGDQMLPNEGTGALLSRREAHVHGWPSRAWAPAPQRGGKAQPAGLPKLTSPWAFPGPLGEFERTSCTCS